MKFKNLIKRLKGYRKHKVLTIIDSVLPYNAEDKTHSMALIGDLNNKIVGVAIVNNHPLEEDSFFYGKPLKARMVFQTMIAGSYKYQYTITPLYKTDKGWWGVIVEEAKQRREKELVFLTSARDISPQCNIPANAADTITLPAIEII